MNKVLITIRIYSINRLTILSYSTYFEEFFSTFEHFLRVPFSKLFITIKWRRKKLIFVLISFKISKIIHILKKLFLGWTISVIDICNALLYFKKYFHRNKHTAVQPYQIHGYILRFDYRCFSNIIMLNLFRNNYYKNEINRVII